ncbi:MAG TPA: hypothetical protein PLD37_11775, partial [Usitatibacteraceae bacterium]|nr:hypothetical protein [Usitatibacteraceae bacterium]
MSASSLRVRRILYAGALLRALAIGLMAVLIGLYCARLGFSPSQIGVVLSAALWGSALAALATMLAGRHVSERWLLVALTLLPAAGGAVIAGSDAFPAVA